jgi:hypothetical protein
MAAKSSGPVRKAPWAAEKHRRLWGRRLKLFFRFVLGYLAVSFVIAALIRRQGMQLLRETATTTYDFGSIVANVAVLLVPLMLAIPLFLGWRKFVANINHLGYALIASAVLQTAFSLIKSTIPMIVPFYADPALARADRWLHGGTDPWEIAHRIGAYLPIEALLPVYLSVWVVPAVGLAVILSVADDNTERKARFLVLYLFCWLVIGNVLAILGASVGPVFYDALEGGTRFVGLHAALAQSGVTQGPVGQIQAFLWQSYAERGMAIGSGISAFPSVHVGIATLTALYLAERSRWLAPIGVAFVATILFLSVYTGYHYALDGYVSVLLVTGAWALLRRVELTAMGGLLAAPQAGRPGDRAAELTTSDTRA